MSIKGFKIIYPDGQPKSPDVVLSDFQNLDIKTPFKTEYLFHTGTYDRNGRPIYEGDQVRQVSCEIPFNVEDIVSFLIMCGRYEEKHGAPIFDSLEVVDV